MADVVNEELWAHNVMHELGFSEPSINAALEKTLSLMVCGRGGMEKMIFLNW